MASSYDDRELLSMLSELEQLDTAEWMSSALFELALDQLIAGQESHSPVGAAIGQLMRAELRYYRQVEQAADAEELHLDALDRLYQGHQQALQHNLRNLLRVVVSSPAGRAARSLAAAECCLRLGRLDQALHHLSAAQEAGVPDSLLHLVMGYTRYQQALCAFPRQGKLTEEQYLQFQLACLRAVSAFEQGLGADLDAQLYWWIGSVLEVSGFTEAAEEAFRKAEESEEKMEEDDEDDEEMENASDAEADLPQIDPAEERQVYDALKKPNGLEQLLGPDADDDME